MQGAQFRRHCSRTVLTVATTGHFYLSVLSLSPNTTYIPLTETTLWRVYITYYLNVYFHYWSRIVAYMNKYISESNNVLYSVNVKSKLHVCFLIISMNTVFSPLISHFLLRILEPVLSRILNS